MSTSSASHGLQFLLRGRNALFADPLTRMGGEKFTYQVPTHEAIKGVLKSIYWKPTFVWVVDELRVLNPIRTQSRGLKPLKIGGGNDLATYTYLVDVAYQVRAHFEWNLHRPEMASDRQGAKHQAIAQRMLERGGRQDVFLGTRECQAYVEPCAFGAGPGHYDQAGELSFGLMFHGFDYPDESGHSQLVARFDRQTMVNGVVAFTPPSACRIRKTVRPMGVKSFVPQRNVLDVEAETSTVFAGEA